MLRLLSIIGARPQIIKAAAISRAVRTQFAGQIEEHILHTGQHYDDNMSEVFFRELGIPSPDYNLHVGSGSHAEQTGEMLKGIEKVLQGEPIGNSRLEIGDVKPFDGVILYGDTNSTLAGALAASKLQVPVFHVEAGLRSFNMSMPEEINRIVADRLGNLLFAPTQTAVRNLEAEGVGCNVYGEQHAWQKVVLSGDVMYDNSMYFSAMADMKSDIIERLGLSYRNFVLATIHRPANTDNPENLRSIFRALSDIAASGVDVIFPCHPRTRKKLSDESLEFRESSHFHLIDPVSFFEIIRLEKNARVVMTDSGGVQKEAFFYGTPCVILRPETEWVEIVDAGAGILADAGYERIMKAYADLSGREVYFPPLFGDAHASERILSEIIDFFN
ncbi:MAG: UDP-N-acetylglucosamine 2-epimerase (non-hydrolyzing) [Paludibacteraceae bacterium]|nr:UDP-N-acetylglucosamine 2-epimerase (non-hydrolyzing) [Paludibacteraceae bacterium]